MMNVLKKILILALAASFLLSACPITAAQGGVQGVATDGSLRFNDDGTFKIALVADTQENQVMTPYIFSSLNALLDNEKPDLVLFLGDQVYGPHPFMFIGDKQANVKSVIERTVAPVAQRSIPFAVVFGNHDSESGISKEYQMSLYQSFPTCIAVDEGDALPGCGTYNIPIYSSDGSHVALNLFMLDSHEYADDGGYGAVQPEQIEWMNQTAKALADQNGGVPVPSYAFQHIIVPEVYDALEQTEKGDNSIKGNKGFSDRYYALDSACIIDGGIYESPSPPNKSTGEFDAFKESGVSAAFFGHDHVNTFTIEYEGIRLVSATGSTYSSYNNDSTRGTRILELTQDELPEYGTKLVKYSDYEDKSIFSQIARIFLVTGVLPNSVKQLLLVVAVLIIAIRLLTRKARKRRKAEKLAAKAAKASGGN